RLQCRIRFLARRLPGFPIALLTFLEIISMLTQISGRVSLSTPVSLHSLIAMVSALVPLALAAKPKPAAVPEVPEWAKRAVWYQIFPERFRNGDTANDPRLPDLAGSWPHVTPSQWNISPWTSDWYKLQPWETTDTNGFYYHAQLRRYGGD